MKTPFAKHCELEALAAERLAIQYKVIACMVTPSEAVALWYSLAARMRALAEEPDELDPIMEEFDKCEAVKARNRAAAEPCSCEEAEELRKQVIDLQTLCCDQRNAFAEMSAARAEAVELKRDLQAALESENTRRKERDTARAEAESMQAKTAELKAKTAELKATSRAMRDCLGEANAEVERLKLELASAVAERDSLQADGVRLAGTVETLKAALAAAQDRLPEWAKRVTAGTLRCLSARGWSAQAQAEIELRKAVSDLTYDQRRQCEEPGT